MGAPWTLPEQEGRSPPSCLGPPPLRQESGRPPRPALAASGSPPWGSTAAHSGLPGSACWRSAESAPRPGSGRQPGPGPPAPSLRRPTGRAPRDPGLLEPLATFVQGGERCGSNICIYIFNCRRNLPSGKDQRVLQAARGRGSRLAAEGRPGLRGGGGAGAPPELGARRGFRCSGEALGPQCLGPISGAGLGDDLRLHSPRCPLPRPPGDPRAVPCRPGLSFPDCSLPGRLTVSSPAPEGGGVISTKAREEGSGPP